MNIPRRPLGVSGLDIPVLGLGTGEGGMGLSDRKAVRLYRYALDCGITFIDTSPGYGTAHRQIARAIRGRREDVVLATKAPTADGEACTRTFEKSLRELRTDYVDIAYIHSLGEQDVDQALRDNGALAALIDMKRRGLARFIGFTAHNQAARAARVVRECDAIDVVMIAINYIESHIYGFERKLVPVAKERGVGVIAMKLYGGAPEMVYKKPVPSALEAREGGDHETAFRYGLSLPGISSVVIGCYRSEEIDANLAYLRRFRPLTADEAADLLVSGRRVAPRWGERYGPAE